MNTFRSILFSIITIFIIGFIFQSCKDSEPVYIDYEVAFFKDSPNLIVTPTQWDTLTEQILRREGHKAGATFTIVTEQRLAKDAWTSVTATSNDVSLEMVTDVENNTIQNVNCKDFLEISELTEIENPAQFRTVSWEVVLVDGTGADVPAEFTTISYQRLISNATYVDGTNSESTISFTMTFRLLEGEDPGSYIRDEFRDMIQFDCIEGVSFRVL